MDTIDGKPACRCKATRDTDTVGLAAVAVLRAAAGAVGRPGAVNPVT